MGRNLRDFRNEKEFVGFFNNRVSWGLPFHPTYFMRETIAGIVAKCQENHPVTICHMMWMSNHFHMIISGSCKNISKFFAQLQSEISKLIKTLTNDYPGALWESRYSMQRIGRGVDVIDRIAYLYANPMKAGLVSTVSEWEGLHTYNMYVSGSLVKECKHIGIKNFKKINPNIVSFSEAEQRRAFKEMSGTKHNLVINPNAWKYCFNDYRDKSDLEIYKEIDAEIKHLEWQYAMQYKNKFMGMEKIKKQPLVVKHKPKEKTPAPVIFCRDKEKRIQMILDYKEFCEHCHERYKAWRCGEITKEQYQYGAYRPGMPLISQLRITA